MNREKQALNLDDVNRSFKLTNLDKDSPFYVDVDAARDGEGRASVRQRVVYSYKSCGKNNCENKESYGYHRELFIGHKACGKTTELHKIEYELRDYYYTVYISDIEKSEDRVLSQTDFLYFIIEKILENYENSTKCNWGIDDELNKLKDFLERKIFGDVKEEIDIKSLAQMEIQGEASVKLLNIVLKLFAKIGAKSYFEETTNKKLTLSIKNNFDEFLNISNQIIGKIQVKLSEENKMLLLILDGLDKIKEASAEEIFLGTQSFLTKLNCSMIVTFPIYLLYSPRKNQAVSYFDEYRVLSMIKVHERDGKDCELGINALTEITKKRMNTGLFESEEALKEAIRLSGGNLRDYFKFISNAAVDSQILGKKKIEKSSLEAAYNDVKSDYQRQLVESYMPFLEELFYDEEKNSLMRKDPKDDTLLNMFESGVLIEYNGKRWCDLHPLVKEIVADRIEQKKENGND